MPNAVPVFLAPSPPRPHAERGDEECEERFRIPHSGDAAERRLEIAALGDVQQEGVVGAGAGRLVPRGFPASKRFRPS